MRFQFSLVVSRYGWSPCGLLTCHLASIEDNSMSNHIVKEQLLQDLILIWGKTEKIVPTINCLNDTDGQHSQLVT